MDQFAEWLGISRTTLDNLLLSLGLVVVLIAGRLLVLRWFRSLFEDPDQQFRAKKLTNTVSAVVLIFSLGFIWIDAFDSLATYLGLVSAGIAVALGDLLKNMAAYFYILTRHPMRIGDRIEIRGISGDVLDIRLFRFTVMEVGNWVHADQSTGRLVHIPNGALFVDALLNYTEGFTHIWDELAVQITFESNWERAEEIIAEAIEEQAPKVEADARVRIRETARDYRIKVGTLTPITYLTVADSGVQITARYLVEARQRRTVHSALWRGILERVDAESSVHFAYPTVRTYLEGPIAVAHPDSA